MKSFFKIALLSAALSAVASAAFAEQGNIEPHVAKLLSHCAVNRGQDVSEITKVTVGKQKSGEDYVVTVIDGKDTINLIVDNQGAYMYVNEDINESDIIPIDEVASINKKDLSPINENIAKSLASCTAQATATKVEKDAKTGDYTVTVSAGKTEQKIIVDAQGTHLYPVN